LSKKIIFPFFSFLLVLFSFFQLINLKPKINPNSDKNIFLSQLKHALNISQIDINNLKLRDFDQEIEFYTQDCQIILSQTKDPYWQVGILQQIFKTAKIRGKEISLIDLSNQHPYATLKNN